MSRHEMRFAGLWRAPLPPGTMYAKLADIEHYPGWWPAFRSVKQTGERECELVIRSMLPYELTVRLTPVVEDPVERVLEAALEGDIAGNVRWCVGDDGGHGCVASFTEHVSVRKAALRRWMPLARPFFHLNHAVAMRSGQRGVVAGVQRRPGRPG
ncbi:polyketide cyclase [Streptomyces aureoversilis]|uniref:Polyketide cyclase n=1 Tax=Streptomyces aureoversilis TaxID=67277 RepID=A0ABV9ZW50_9ACTN